MRLATWSWFISDVGLDSDSIKYKVCTLLPCCTLCIGPTLVNDNDVKTYVCYIRDCCGWQCGGRLLLLQMTINIINDLFKDICLFL